MFFKELWQSAFFPKAKCWLWISNTEFFSKSSMIFMKIQDGNLPATVQCFSWKFDICFEKLDILNEKIETEFFSQKFDIFWIIWDGASLFNSKFFQETLRLILVSRSSMLIMKIRQSLASWKLSYFYENITVRYTFKSSMLSMSIEDRVFLPKSRCFHKRLTLILVNSSGKLDSELFSLY